MSIRSASKADGATAVPVGSRAAVSLVPDDPVAFAPRVARSRPISCRAGLLRGPRPPSPAAG